MLGIIGAMDVEVNEIKKKIENPAVSEYANIEFVSGRIEGEDVCAAQCGTGKVNAALCAQLMLDRFGVEKIINLGIGGSLSKAVSVKNVVVATEVCQHDIDTTLFNEPPGFIGGLNIVKIPADSALSLALENAAKRCGKTVHRGCIASGDAFISSDEAKEKIADEFGAVCCEMEGGAIGQVCYANGVPFAVLRTISDNSDGELIDYPTLRLYAAETSSSILLEYIKKESR